MTTLPLERRYTPGRVEARARKAEKRTIGGYAAVFNRTSQNLGGFVEVVSPDFFKKSRADGWPEVIARYNHDDNRLLGTTSARTLRLDTDNIGLFYEVDLPHSREDVMELVERGDVNKSSFAFRVFEEDWGLSEQGFPQRTLLSGQLIDVAPVNLPAYSDTSVGKRFAVNIEPPLRSLALKMGADYEEVRKMAEHDELTKFFIKTGTGEQRKPRPKPTVLGALAKMRLEELKDKGQF